MYKKDLALNNLQGFVISVYGCKERNKHSCKNKEHEGT